jgi:rhodanese-related sulfurtransferase
MMKKLGGLIIKALLIAAAASCVGLGLNVALGRNLPWIYVPPVQVEFKGVKIPLIDEKEARRLFDDPGTVFVDTREPDDFAKRHVRGAVLLTPEGKEERFLAVEMLLPRESRLILYCYGPECDMAEKVAEFLVDLDYSNLAIMRAGFPAWLKAGYPIDQSAKRGEQ